MTIDNQSTFYSNGQARTLEELRSFKLLRAKEPNVKECRSIDVTNSEVSSISHLFDCQTLKALTVHIVGTYRDCNRKSADGAQAFTALSQPFRNDGFDNADGDYICRANDTIYNPEGYGYEMLNKLGHGTFGQVIRCVTPDNKFVAVKIIKNKPAYFQQAFVELRILQTLNRHFDRRVVRMLDYFVFRKHLCIVFELLSSNLFEVLKLNAFRGLPYDIIRSMVDQLVRALVCLKCQSIIHCDLKPENILLTHSRQTNIKLIDFGSAAFAGFSCYTYIQSRFYRSPEVILGIHPFTPAIDMWSVGCILAELFLGVPFFPGSYEYDQLCRVVEAVGPVPVYLLEKGKHLRKFYSPVIIEESLGEDINGAVVVTGRFMRVGDELQPVPEVPHPNYYSLVYCEPQGMTRIARGYRMHSAAEFSQITSKMERPSKRYAPASFSLREMIFQMPHDKPKTEADVLQREKILHFMRLCFEYDPKLRLTPAQALTHPLLDPSALPLAEWRPRSESECMRVLTEDQSSFLYTSSSQVTEERSQTPQKRPPLRPSRGLPPLHSHHVGSAPVSSENVAPVVQVVEKSQQPGIPLPDDSMPQSYRPPMNQLPDSYFQGFIHGKYQLNAGHPLPLGVSPPVVAHAPQPPHPPPPPPRGFAWSRAPPSSPGNLRRSTPATPASRPASAATLYFQHSPSPHAPLPPAPIRRVSPFSTCSSESFGDVHHPPELPPLPPPAGSEWCVLQSGSNTPYGEGTPKTVRSTPYHWGRSPMAGDDQQEALLQKLAHAMGGISQQKQLLRPPSAGVSTPNRQQSTPVLGPGTRGKRTIWGDNGKRGGTAARRE